MSNVQQTNFTGGELSSQLFGRTDLQKYYDGAALLENMLVLNQGPATRRGGTRFVAAAKHHDRAAILVEFVYSTVQAYILEFGHNYVRFYKDGGQIQASGGGAYEVATPYAEADLPYLRFTQSTDTLIISHKSYAPRRLVRLDHNDWRLHLLKIDYAPLARDLYEPAAILTPGAVTGVGITFTTSAPAFLAGDVGCSIQVKNGQGKAEITAFVSTTNVTCTIYEDLDSVAALPAGSWILTGGPRHGRTWYWSAAYTDGVLTNQYYAKGIIITLTCDINIFRASDVGKYIRMLGGCVQLTAYSSATVMQAKIMRDLPITTCGYTQFGVFSVESPGWNDARGWPWHMVFFENRLIAAGSNSQPQTIWGSESGDYYNFLPGSLDADGFEWTIGGTQVNAVQWLAGAKKLFLGTKGAEFVVGSAAEPLSPNRPSLAQETDVGSQNLRAVQHGNQIMFAADVTGKLHGILYDLDTDAFVASDLHRLAEHLVQNFGVMDIAVCKGPQAIIWMTRSDGTLIGMSHMSDKKQGDLDAWHQHSTVNGAVERVATIPGENRKYETWLLVRRTIGGVTKRYLEILTDYDFTALADAFYVDCGLTGDYDPPTSTVSGLDHLEGQEVAVLADGAVQNRKTVTGGSITLDVAATKVHVGLPMTSKVKSMPLSVPGNINTIKGALKRIREVQVQLYRSLGFKLGPDEDHLEIATFRAPGQPMGQAVPLFTGNKKVLFRQGPEEDVQVLVVQDLPLPLTVQGLVLRFETATGQ